MLKLYTYKTVCKKNLYFLCKYFKYSRWFIQSFIICCRV